MIGNNRHSDRTFVSEHICIRLALFAVRACSLSPSLSPSLFLLSFLPSLSPTLVLAFTSSPPSRFHPVSRFRFSLSCPLFRNVPFCRFSSRNFPLALSRATRNSVSSLLSDARSSSNQRDHVGQPLASYVHPLVPSLFFSSLCFVPSFRLSFPGLLHRSFFIALPGWSIAPSLALPHWGVLFRRCLYIATGWYAGAYIIRRARVRVYVQGSSRLAHARKVVPRYVCISVL